MKLLKCLITGFLILLLFNRDTYAQDPFTAREPEEIKWLQEAAALHAERIRDKQDVEQNTYWYNTYMDLAEHLRGRKTKLAPQELFRRMLVDVELDTATAKKLQESDAQSAAWYAQWAERWKTIATKIRL